MRKVVTFLNQQTYMIKIHNKVKNNHIPETLDFFIEQTTVTRLFL